MKKEIEMQIERDKELRKIQPALNEKGRANRNRKAEATE